MLDVLRKSSGSWVVKILFVLLILSFGVWGVGDVVRGLATDRVAIKVGDLEYDPAYVSKQFARQVDQFRGMFGQNFTAESAKQLGLLDNTIAGIVASATQEMAARDLGLTISDVGLKQAITSQPYFRGANGQFDRELYQRTLMSNNMNEEQYLKLVRPDIVTQRLTGAVESNGAAPRPLVEALYRHQKESRDGEALMVQAAAQSLDRQASDDDLKAVYEANAARFLAPETRSFAAILLRSEDMMARVEVSAAEVESHYAANADFYSVPEQRDTQQVIADSEAAATAIAAAAKTPADLAAAAAANRATLLPMGPVARDALLPEVADTVFALQAGQVSAAVQSPLGWHVFAVTAVVPPSKKSLEDVRADITAELKRSKAEEAIYQVAKQTEDTLSSGIGFAEAAKQLNLPLIQAGPVTAEGLDEAGRPVTTLPEGMRDALLARAFSLQVGEESRVEQTEAGQYILRVDTITPAAQRPLDSVRADVTRLWEDAARKTKAEAVAQSLLEQVKAGKSLANLADPTKGVVLGPIPAITRDGRGSDGKPVVSRALAQKLFALAPGGADWTPSDGGAAVIRLGAVKAADPAADKAGVDAIAQSMRQATGADLIEAATQGFGSRYTTTIKRELIEKAL